MLKDNERLDLLIKEDLKIIQNDDVFSFSTDALLLGILPKLEKDKIIDICSGNGVIPLLLSHKGSQTIEGIEIQQQLVDMAKRSFKYNQLDDRLLMHQMDVKRYIIISNLHNIRLLHAILHISKIISCINIKRSS